jgi:N-acetylglutamate synthase-like GNAT family acetyltransferase
MSTVSLRLATAADAAAAHGLVAELGYAGLDRQTFASGFAAVLADRSQQVWLADLGGKVVALMTLGARPQVRLGGVVMTIDELVVTEGARGAGVGTTLLERAKAEATKAGARRLELHTARGRQSYERGFYAKAGFVEVDSAVMRWEGGLSAVTR